ncbi:MAG: thioredoxin [Dehalococcoidia bacterium]|nr:thioredoxin [Dehalococcoidia bacterium]
MTTDAVLDTTEATFEQDVLVRSRDVPVIVDFWAPWCGPCRTLGPTLEGLAAEYSGRLQLVKLNTDENQRLAGAFKIESIPRVMAFRDGKVVDQFVGALPEPEVRAFVERLLPSAADGEAGAGLRALQAGQLDLAGEHLQAALGADPKHRTASLVLARLKLEQGALDEAAELALRWPGEPESKQILARINLRRTVGSASREELEARLAADEGDAEAHYRLGCLLALEGAAEPAVDHLLETVALDRKLDEDGGRLRLFDVFTLLGDKHDLVQDARLRLANVLF